jgi:hypothetical protein
MRIVQPLIDCSDALSDSGRLQWYARKSGYLFFPGLLPEDEVLKVRHEVLDVAESFSLLAEGTDPNDAIRREGVYVDLEYERNPTPEVRGFFNSVHGLRAFNAFFHHPVILEVIELLFGESILVHPRVICHVLFPGHHEHTAEPHQDLAPVRGTDRAWTVWTPLGDCENSLGGVAIAPGSHRRGLLDPDALVKGQLTNEETVWGWSPFSCGDVLMFSSLTVHQGRDNVTDDRIRLSTSARYQPVSEPVDALALRPQRRWAEWEEIYADWDTDDPLKYYWKSLQLDVRTYR